MGNPAETYEREMVPALFRPWAPLLLAAAAPQPGERVLDLACGTGVVARLAASRVDREGRIVGLDLNPGMLAVARASAEREGLTIDWQEGRAEALPFADGEFDLVLCQQGLQFFEDRARALAEVRRVLRAGGRFALSLWLGLDRHPFFALFNEAIVRHLGIPALAAPFALGDVDTVRAVLRDAGFSDIEIEPRSLAAIFPDPAGFIAMEVDVIAAAIPSAQHLDDRARMALAAALTAEMAEPIQEQVRDGRLLVDMHAHLVRARRPAE